MAGNARIYRNTSIVHAMGALAEVSARSLRRSSPWLVLLTLAFALIAPGCATPIGVRYVEPRVAYHSLTANVLSAERPSSFSARELMNLNLYERFNEDPEKALAEMHSGLAAKGDEDRVFALAELSFVYANDSGERSHYLASAIYAYAFLLPGKHGTPPKGLDPRFRWAADIYNQALTRAAMLDDREHPVPRGGTFKLPFGEITVEFDEKQLHWAGFRLTDFVPAADVEVRGLRNRYRTPGIGAPLAAKIEPIEGAASKQSALIPLRMRIPATAFLRLDDPRGALKSGKLKGKLEFYTPDSARSLKIEGVDVPIEYETTSALALTLEGAPVWDFEIAGFRSGDFKIGAPGALREGLFMVRPHRTGRIPVVLVHGTASSPARWAELLNELENDPRFLENYEIWLFMYNTGNPIADSAARLRASLLNVVADLDPEKKDAGLQQMVVIGHSQGGLLTKMMVIDPGTRFWDAVFTVPPDELDVTAETRDFLKNALIFKPLPFVRRVVFVATPHRGSYQALGFFGGFASWLVNLPGNLTRLGVEAATLQTRGMLRGPFTGIPTAITNMNPSNRFIQGLASTPMVEGVTAHSIIAVQGDGPPGDGADGIVMYKSAHIDGVVSEKVVRSSHSTQGHPETIQEIKRILLEHTNGLAGRERVVSQPAAAGNSGPAASDLY
jgi:pimeloyl-ACP methyl ester carboxylesterase